MRKFILGSILFLNVWQSMANVEKILSIADSLFQKEQYIEAFEMYKSVEDQNYESASLYYNMGNSAYKLNKLAYSILYFEKALKLAPKDEDILYNLNLARGLQIDKIEELPSSVGDKLKNGFASITNSSTWSYLSLIFFGLGLVFFILLIGRYYDWRKSFIGLSIVIILAIFCTASAWISARVESVSFGILMEANAYVKTAPLEKSDDAFIIHQGLKVKIIEEYNDWLKIKLADGKVGWLKNNQLEII